MKSQIVNLYYWSAENLPKTRRVAGSNAGTHANWNLDRLWGIMSIQALAYKPNGCLFGKTEPLFLKLCK